MHGFLFVVLQLYSKNIRIVNLEKHFTKYSIEHRIYLIRFEKNEYEIGHKFVFKLTKRKKLDHHDAYEI